MPGKGRLIERDYTPEERNAMVEAGLVATRSSSPAVGEGESRSDSFLQCLGEKTYDVYLNDVAYWKNIPARVWEYTIGGYQVIKKWLSYREHKLLGRPLTTDDAREVMNIACRIAASSSSNPPLMPVINQSRPQPIPGLLTSDCRRSLSRSRIYGKYR